MLVIRDQCTFYASRPVGRYGIHIDHGCSYWLVRRNCWLIHCGVDIVVGGHGRWTRNRYDGDVGCILRNLYLGLVEMKRCGMNKPGISCPLKNPDNIWCNIDCTLNLCHWEYMLNEITRDELWRIHTAVILPNITNRQSWGEKKPKMGRCMSRRLACLCTRINYLNHTDGVGCLKCKWACIKFKKTNMTSRPYFDANYDCKCKIYQCQWSVMYFRLDLKKLAKSASLDYSEANNKTS